MKTSKIKITALVIVMSVGAGWALKHFTGLTFQFSHSHLVGTKVVDFTFYDFENNPNTLAQLPPGPVLLNFWATWCEPCIEELPLLNTLQKDYADTVTVVIISIDSPVNSQLFIENLNINLLSYYLDFNDSIGIMKNMGNDTESIPFSVLLDSDRIIRLTHNGALSIDWLEEYLIAL